MLLAASGAIPLTKVVVLPASRLSHADAGRPDADRPADGRPFPCQTHRCGCHSAEACGNECCCYSPAEVAAWYEEHADELAAYNAVYGLEVPSVADADADADANIDVCSTPRPGCCPEHLDAEPATEPAIEPADFADVEPAVEQFVALPISIDAVRRCQGLASLWLLLSQALPADSTPLWQFDESTTATVDVYAAVCPNVGDRPDSPPPRA